MNPRLQGYVPLVNFIAEVVGPNCEVVLHDLSDLEHSVVAISDNRLTGRSAAASRTLPCGFCRTGATGSRTT